MGFWKRLLRLRESSGPSRVSVSSREERREWLEFLARSRLFSRLPARVLELIVSYLDPRDFEDGQALMRQGDRGDCLMILLDGKADVVLRLESGENRQLARLGARDIVGEMALLTREPRNASVISRGKTRVLALPAEAFDELSGRYPEISVVLTDLLAERLGNSQIDGLGSKLLEGFRIRSRLGRGGMAVVYEAEEVDTSRNVALKMMSHRLIYDSDAFDRFQREIDVAESFDHVNITRVYRRFEAYKTYFMVMELCKGPSLKQLIRAHGGLDQGTCRAILGQLAKALGNVHERGVLHRDIKPANVMITPEGTIKLTDFGLARPKTFDGITQSGVIVGTPAYMCPEQLAGTELTTKVDIYALGCIVHEMLTGKPLFGEGDFTSLIYQKLTWTLPEREEIRSDLSADLYSVLRESLAKIPEDRILDLTYLESWAAPVDAKLLEGLPLPEGAEEASHDDDGAVESRGATRTAIR